MNFNIKYQPNFALLELELGPGETIVAESGAMVAKSTDVKLEPKLSSDPNAGGFEKSKVLLSALVRKMIGGESFFVTHFTTSQNAKLWVAPSLSGDIRHHKLNNSSIRLSSGAYLASTGDITVKPRWGGIKSFFAKEGAFILEAQGTGDLFFNSFGGIVEIEVDGEYIVDNGHLVAWESGLTYNIERAGQGLKALFASGEGLVCNFKGKGKVWIQTRNVSAFSDWVNAHF